MSVTVKHTSAALTDILLAADKLRGLLGRQCWRLLQHLGKGCDGTTAATRAHRVPRLWRSQGVGSHKTKWFQVGPACIHWSQRLAPRRLEVDLKRRTSHRPCS